MFSRICRIIVVGLVTAGLSAASAVAVSAADVTIFAAASLKNALEEIRQNFEAETDYSLTLSLAGSSLLARQIELGAPADIFLPANSRWMDHLEASGRLEPGSRRDLLGNRLVLVAPAQAAKPISGFDDPLVFRQLGQGRVAMALIQAVPAGIYGKEALQSLGLWEKVAGQVAQSDNVRAALALVAAGEAPLGVVYATDALVEPRVTVLAQFPASSHAPIRYPLAQIQPENPAAAPAVAAFLAYLQSSGAQEVFSAAGFEVITE